jgi:hypothetical protein
VEQLVVAALGWKSGLSSVSLRPKCLSLPETMTRSSGFSRRSMNRRPNHVASIVPGLVLEDRDRPLDAAPERGLDANVDDARPRRDDRPVLDPDQLAELAHLAQVVVAPRQVEQQLADRVEAEPPARPLQHRGRGNAGIADRRLESSAGSVGTRTATFVGVRAFGPATSYSAEIR